MPTNLKTPGVYVVEKNAFPNSVVEVATAVPAFIGYTQKAVNKKNSLVNKPWRISSMAEFKSYFGGAPKPKFELAEEECTSAISFNGKKYSVKRKDQYSLYYHILLFYANGGGSCYIVSIGDYSSAIDAELLTKGLEPLLKEQEPTMVVVPEAVTLSDANCYALQQAVLKHCGSDMRNRIALLDIYGGYKSRNQPTGDDVVDDFREAIGSDFLSFGAAYYPWVNTSVVQENELDYETLDTTKLKALLKAELGLAHLSADKNEQMTAYIKSIRKGLSSPKRNALHKNLSESSKLYSQLMQEIRLTLNLLPTSAAMAGVITTVDNTRGVWKAPANVSIASVISPSVNISQVEQEDLNVSMSGKSINTIRSFPGEGVLVWGARTLDGNSLDWRYINVRRTMIMLEESIKSAARAYVFEPNVASTWVNVKSMINNFLIGIWKRGGLAGATPTDAFNVFVGLGETMTAEDILEGIMRVTVLVAIVRPGEFIELTFQQQMQKN